MNPDACKIFAFATIERELLDRCRFRTQAEARLAVFEFIAGWYNHERPHQGLDYQTPAAVYKGVSVNQESPRLS